MTRRKNDDRQEPCNACLYEPVIRLKEPDRHLCAEHFSAYFLRRADETIRTHGMIKDGDRIAVAFSGGKDSTALILLLNSLIGQYRDVALVAVTIDEGIAGYREATVRSAENLARDLNAEHRIISFTDVFGKDLDTILKGHEERACSICGILRRKALVRAAQEAGSTKIATGHNLDDEAQSVLMNVLRGDLPRLIRDSSEPSGGCFIPRIKPLMEISEKEIAVYLMVNNRLPDLPHCPYTGYALRAEVRAHLNRLEYLHPGTMRRLVTGNERFRQILSGVSPRENIGSCRECAEPCSGTTCQACRLIESVMK